MASYPPELLAQVLSMGGLDEKQARLQQQLQRAQALRQVGGQRRSTPLGTALEGLAGVGGALAGGLIERNVGQQMAALGQQRTAGREAFVRGLGQAEQQGRQQEAGALLSQRPFVPMADEYNTQSLALRDETARQGAQQRQRDATGLAALSGDPLLRGFVAAQQQEGPNEALELRRQALEQGERRLDQTAAAEQRRASALEKTLGLKAQQMKAQQEENERKAAAKKVADSLNLEEGLRKEVTGSKTFKDYVEASVGLDKVARAANDNSPAGDIALVFGLMKTLDPGSTVREGEQAQASQATNVPGQVLNMYNRVVSGTRLTPEQRADFTRTARNQFGAYESAFNRHLDFYKGVGSRAGVNLQNVIPGAAAAPAIPTARAPQAAPAQQAALSPEDAAALDWARSNPNDPRAAQILQRLGVQ